MVIGSHRDVESARLSEIRQFFQVCYVPNNASLVIAGDFDRRQAKIWIEKYFGPIPAGQPIPKITVQTPPITSERTVEVTDQIQLPRVYMAWISPPAYQSGDAECNLLAQILGGATSSRLYKSLVYEKQIAQNVRVENNPLRLGSIFILYATAKPGVKPEQLERAIDDEINNLREAGTTEAELKRAQNVIKTRMLTNLEDYNHLADQLNRYNQYLGTPDYLSQDLARYENVSVDDLKQASNRELQSSARVVVTGIPGKKVIDDIPNTSLEEKNRSLVIS